MEKQESRVGSSSQSVQDVSDDAMSTLEPINHWEIRLSWSEYVDGKWAPKQISKEFIKKTRYSLSEQDLLFAASISPTTEQLTIAIIEEGCTCPRGKFQLSDIQSPVAASSEVECESVGTGPSNYSYAFSSRAVSAKLELSNTLYLNSVTDHKLLPIDTQKGQTITLDDPFFFSDDQRTYFVRPVTIRLIEKIKKPARHKPFIPEIVDDSRYAIPVDVPDFGPDDYLPVEGTIRFATAKIQNKYLRNCRVSNEPVMATFLKAANTEEPEVSRRTTRTVRSTKRVADVRQVDSKKYAATSSLNEAFDAIGGAVYRGPEFQFGFTEGLEFHTFYHPWSSQYVANLNQGGLSRGSKPPAYPAGLMECDTEILSDEGGTFEDAYDPNFTNGLVQKPADFETRTYYKENVCFDVYGANSLYNWELFFHAPLYIASEAEQERQVQRSHEMVSLHF